MAGVVWSRLGSVAHYLEPFFGSGAVLLNRPGFNPDDHTETICDADGFVCNVWRALQKDPDAVAKVCDWPVNHADLMARKKRMNAEIGSLLKKLCDDETYFDVNLAGYWIWGTSCSIGAGMISSPRQIPHLGQDRGMHAKGKRGTSTKIPLLAHSCVGVHAKGARGGARGVQDPYSAGLWRWFRALSERLRYVRVVCGDWSRICGGNWQDSMGVCGVFFDPPYGEEAGRARDLYVADCLKVAKKVRRWCRKRGDNPNYRICLAGYDVEHAELEDLGWEKYSWSAQGGYGNQSNGKNQNRHRETLWFSPHCLKRDVGFFSEYCISTPFDRERLRHGRQS